MGPLAVATILLVSGCSNPLDAERDTFEESLRRWEAAAVSHYTFRFRLNCFCGGPGIRPVDIEVRGGRVVGASYPDSEPPELFELTDYPTIPDLFSDIEQALERKPFSVLVEYDKELGYPRDFFADFEQNAIDEELGFFVVGLTPLTD